MSIIPQVKDLKNHPTIAADLAVNEAPTVLLSEETLAEIKARTEAAVPPPWDWQDGILFFSIGYWPISQDQRQANQTFIAHARADIPALLAHIEALQAQLKAVQL